MNEEVRLETVHIHSRADELIACLEGEIAKRDARILELESQYQRDVWGLNNEGDPIGGEPAGGYANDNARLRAELAALKAQEPVQVDCVAVMRADGDGGLEVEWLLEGGTAELMSGMYLCCVGGGTLLFEEGSGHLYAAPVSEAKAQGVVMPEPMKRGDEGGSGEYGAAMIRGYNACLREVARLNAAHVQQVSVPDGWKLVPVEPMREMISAAGGAITTPDDLPPVGAGGWSMNDLAFRSRYRDAISAAPAAPAADAGIVDMYRHLQKVTPYRFKKIQDASITDGGDVMYFHKDRFDAALLADMAAHSSKGVV